MFVRANPWLLPILKINKNKQKSTSVISYSIFLKEINFFIFDGFVQQFSTCGTGAPGVGEKL
jgi:hypothetical protein